MTAQPVHGEPYIPPMRTIKELRAALIPAELETFDAELGAIDPDSPDALTRMRRITQAYRHQVIMRSDPAAMAVLTLPHEEFAGELRQKMAGAGGR